MRYPIFIATKGRAGKSSTIATAANEGLPIFLFVEPQEVTAYRQAYPGAEVISILENNKGISYARRFCLGHARDNALPWFWMMDDDIKNMYRVAGGKCIKEPYREILNQAEKDIPLTGAAMGSLEYGQYAWSHKKQFTFNSYCDVAVFINVKKTRMINYRDDCKEDRDFVLQALSLGMSSVRTNWLAFSAPKNGSNKGGLHDAYKGGLEKHWSRRMVELWPGICDLKTKSDGRPDVKIHWSKFK